MDERHRPPSNDPIVEMIGLTKRFPGVLANQDVSLALHRGEIHVLLGENGAGKSTLIAMLSGVEQPDAGEIRVDGHACRIASPRRALDLGIGTVFQHGLLVPSLTLVENVVLGAPWWRAPDRPGFARRLADLAAELGLSIDPDARTGDLSLGERQQAEILRALLRGSRVLILDEPTSMLTPKGADDLGALMRRLAARGLAIVFVTHKLREAFAYGDRISVLRLGRKVGEMTPAEKAGLDEGAFSAEVLGLMFGAAVQAEGVVPPPAARPRGRVVFEVVDLDVGGPCGVTLDVAEGEILGIAGIDGNGQRPLAETLAGQRPAARGTVRLDGMALEGLGVGGRRAAGLRYVSDDRLGEGTVGAFPVSTNLLLKDVGEAPFWTRGWERRGRIAAHARRLVEAFDIRTPSVETPIGRLSGGNVQKVILARELSGSARVVVYAKPTHGLDVRTMRATRRRIREAAARGVATLLISTDLDELLELCDRIAVLSQRRLVGTLTNDGTARERVAALMVGAPT